MRRYRYALRIDVVQHFPSLDHAVLRGEIIQVIEEDDVLALINLILDSGAGVLANEYTPVYFPGDDLFAIQRPRGLPIGNLTSQFWSNVYLNPLDWHVLRALGCPPDGYLRFVDDMALFSDSKAELWAWRQAIVSKLAELRLTAHESEAQVTPTTQGIPWLGFVVYPTHRRLKRRNVLSFARKLDHNLDLYEAGRIPFAELDASVQGWIAHVDYGDTWGLREHLFSVYPIPPKSQSPR
ncbi:MAG: RNA-directed DNA polymerase [Anaerolineae bacterium]|nr:RNA-directed DNA polymerase [Anaerolineae bacterium]